MNQIRLEIPAWHDMKRRDRDDDRPQITSLAVWLPSLVATAIMLAGYVATFLLFRLDPFAPKVGDMIVFRRGQPGNGVWEAPIAAARLSASGVGACVLDPLIMSGTGGSLVVEARQESDPPVYRLHWAGGRTSSRGLDNCGSSADLTVSSTDIHRLANVAGGFGTDNKVMLR